MKRMIICASLGLVWSLSTVLATDGRQAATLSGRITGIVTAADSGQPAQGVRIELTMTGMAGLGFRDRATESDDQGRFEFKELAAGTYGVTAKSESYVFVVDGQPQSGSLIRFIDVSPGQPAPTLVLSVVKKRAIEGQVTNQAGQPVVNASIQISRRGFLAGRSFLVPVTTSGSTLTDDRGQFRVFGIAPGDYYVLALSGPFAMFSLGAPRPAQKGYAPTFYPGTTTAATAQPVHVSSGGDAVGISFPLATATLSTVSGTVTGPNGEPTAGVSMTLLALSDGDVRGIIATQATSVGNGKFSFANVPSGSYAVQARSGVGMCGTAFGSRVVAVDEKDVPELQVQLSSATVAFGRVTFEGADVPPANQDVRLDSVLMDPVVGPMITANAPIARIGSDWTFEMRGMCGLRALRLVSPAEGWVIKSVLRGSADVTDTVMDFRMGDVKDLEVRLTTATFAVGGHVTDLRGKPVQEGIALIFAEDRAKWKYPSRYVAMGSIGTDGTFTIRNMLPGDYRVEALPKGMPQGDWQNPQVLESVYAAGVRLAGRAGQTLGVDLKIGAVR
jgi:5-hydroxyisourate hydrolase-like protein (transthyretin family)